MVRAVDRIPPAFDVGPTLALAGDYVTVIVPGTSDVTFAGLAALLVVQREAVVLGPALIAVAADHVPFAGAGASLLVATIAGQNSPYVTLAL